MWDKLNQQAHDAEKNLCVLRAALATAAASEAIARLRRARKLHAHFPGGSPIRPSQGDNFVREVASALTRWSQRPKVLEPDGEPIAVLEARLAETNLDLALNTERTASEFENRLGRARRLSARFQHGRPLRPSEDEQLERRIASALTAWESRPDVHVPTGPTAEELAQDLACVEMQLEAEVEGTTRDTRGASRGLFATLSYAIRAIFEALMRLLGRRLHDSSIRPERKQALEERRALIRERIAAREDADRRWEENTKRVREAAEGIQREALAAGSLQTVQIQLLLHSSSGRSGALNDLQRLIVR